MVEFLKMGGVPMIFVLLFGALTLAAAIAFARRPVERMVGMIRGMSIATVFIVLSAIASGLVAVSTNVPQTPEWANHPQIHLIILAGIGESLTPAIVGFSFLAMAWLVTSLGVRRMGQVA